MAAGGEERAASPTWVGVLVFRKGLLPARVVAVLGRLLRAIRFTEDDLRSLVEQFAQPACSQRFGRGSA